MTAARTHARVGASYGWYVVTVLAVVNFFHYGNRNILFPMYEDLRAVYGFGNAEIGLLSTVFMFAHALVSLPLGWAGDRLDRRKVLGAAIAVWSIAAVACAVASGFVTMLLARALVGVATAACVPLANSILCEIVPPEDKARTVSVFNLGLFLGGAAGFGVGAQLGFPLGVVVMGAPGVLLAALVWRLDVAPRRLAETGEASSMTEFLGHARQLLTIRSLRRLIVGAVFMAFAAGGFLAWFFDFMVTSKGISEHTAMIVFGASLVGGLLGVLSGGIVGDRLRARVAYGRVAAIAIGMAATVPFAIITIVAPPGAPFYVAIWLSMYFVSWYHGPMAAIVDDLADADTATTAQALVIFTMHLLGTAPSSWVIGELAGHVGLRHALLVPAGAVVLAALAMVAAFRSIDADLARPRAGSRARPAL